MFTKGAQDKETQYKAVFNAGNTAFKQGDFSAAAQYFKQAIQLKPEGENAKFNLELTLKEIQKQKKSEEKKEGDSSKDQKNKNRKNKNQEDKGQEQKKEEEGKRRRKEIFGGPG